MTEKIGTSSFEKIFISGWRPYFWIAAAIILLYLKSLDFGFTYLDDNVLIVNNSHFLRDLSNMGHAFFQKVFIKGYLPYYRPMLVVSLVLDAQFGGTSAFMYHLTNIIIHAGASCLVFVLLTRLGYERGPSFLFSAIFAVHPALSQGVAWIPGRNDTLLAVFILASFIFFLDLLRKGRPACYLWHLCFFVLALFTKETALVLIPVCVFYLHFIAKEKIFSLNEKALALGWLVGAYIWFLFRQVAVQGSAEMSLYDMLSLMITYAPAALQFIGKVFFPFNLSVFPIIMDTSFIYGFAAMAALVAALVFTKKRRYNYILFGILWAVLFVAPSLIRANTWLVADFLEHRVYVPVIGIIVILSETDLVRNFASKRRILVPAALLIIAVFSAITFFHIDNFRDRFAFWTNAVRTTPHSSFSHLAMAGAYHDNGLLDKAAAEYENCLALDPQKPDALFGLGDIYLKKGMFDKAEKEFKKAIAVYPAYDNAYVELGVLYYRRGRLKEAERAWNRALEFNPNNVVAYKNLAIYYQEQKDLVRAAYCAKRLQEMDIKVPADFLKSVGIKQERQGE